MYYLGIDTSCYTTSVAVVDDNERVVYDGRILLKVEQGGRGLRQSEAVFQHIRNLEPLCSEAMNRFAPGDIGCIAVSSRPRNVEDSYMPVFTTGCNTASIMANCLKVPLFQCSHQQGHTLAGAWSAGMELDGGILVYHISGGTTELLKVNAENNIYEIVGGSEDLNAGQFIDRVGVAMGLGFPCGKEMDKLCRENDVQAFEVPYSVKDSYLSFSGPESYIQRILDKESLTDAGYKAKVAKSVFQSIGKALEKTSLNACIKHNIDRILFVGGVASNSIISDILKNSDTLNKNQIDVIISDPRYSSDNAVGTALYGKREYECNGGLYERG
jgi:N6-L-threonylcarbamoyladenine synthase